MSSVSVGEAGLFHRHPAIEAPARGALVFKDSEPFRPPLRRGPTLVRGSTLSELLGDGPKPSATPLQTSARTPNAHQRRAALDKAERHRRRREHLRDAIAFAHFRDWPLNTAITVTWDKCRYADPAHGRILGLSDRQRSARLRDDIWRALHRAERPFVATWSRAIGSEFGPHLHLGLWWPWEPWELVPLLARLTGVEEAPKRRRRGEVARADGGGWLIQENTAPNMLRGALGWGAYQLKQEAEHPLTAALDGKSLDVSRAISPKAIEPVRADLEAWKDRVGWSHLEGVALDAL